jgi:hypothetical protein
MNTQFCVVLKREREYVSGAKSSPKSERRKVVGGLGGGGRFVNCKSYTLTLPGLVEWLKW